MEAAGAPWWQAHLQRRRTLRTGAVGAAPLAPLALLSLFSAPPQQGATLHQADVWVHTRSSQGKPITDRGLQVRGGTGACGCPLRSVQLPAALRVAESAPWPSTHPRCSALRLVGTHLVKSPLAPALLQDCHAVPGQLLLYNTVEGFRGADKHQLMKQVGVVGECSGVVTRREGAGAGVQVGPEHGSGASRGCAVLEACL